jgi:hypothetical protein
MTDVETTMQRVNTAAFINANPIVLALTPNTRTKTASGGWVDSPQAPRALQTFRLIPQSVSSGAPDRATDGVSRRWPYVLLGMWNAVVQVGDTFEYGELTLQVKHLWPENRYEVRAGVDVRG